MIKDDLIHLTHILENTDLALRFTHGLTEDAFDSDQMVKYACVRCIEVIGEASKNLSETLRLQHPEINWKGAMGIRDRLAHNYMGIDYSIVWSSIQDILPDFKTKIEAIIADL